MKRPTQLDWIIYRIFRWWWNPILSRNPMLVRGLIVEFEKWLTRNAQESI